MTTRAPRPIRPQQCGICRHPQRAQIEMLRCAGASLRALGERFGVGKDAVHRHMASHVSDRRKSELMVGPARVEGLANAAATESRGLLEQLAIVRSVLFNQFLNAAEAGDRGGVANVAGRLLESLRELGRLTGELRQLSGVTVNHNVLNLYASPEFTRLQEGLLKVARAHPEARSDIVELLRSLDTAPSPGLAAGLPTRPGASSSPLIECEAIDAA